MIYTIFIVPLLSLVAGYLMYKYPPKKINYLIGYRTLNSMKNEKIWKNANQYCGKIWIKTGVIMLIITVILSILIYLKKLILTENLLLVIVLCEMISLLLSIFIVENKIKN